MSALRLAVLLAAVLILLWLFAPRPARPAWIAAIGLGALAAVMCARSGSLRADSWFGGGTGAEPPAAEDPVAADLRQAAQLETRLGEEGVGAPVGEDSLGSLTGFGPDSGVLGPFVVGAPPAEARLNT